MELRAGNIEASVEAIEEDIDEHGNRLASVEHAVVNILPGQIALKAEKTEVYTKTEVDGIVDGIEIGGRNLVLNSSKEFRLQNILTVRYYSENK